MVSLMNGLSAMGQGVANYAGTAGLEAQKADLQQQGMVLADQLAHTSKTAENTQVGDINAAAAQKAQDAAMAQLQVTTDSAQKVATIGAGATLGAAGIQAGATLGAAKIAAATSTSNIAKEIAANAPLVAQNVIAATATAGMATDQQAMAHTSFEISTQIAAETAKPPEQQDQGKISQLYNQRMQLGMTPDVQTKFLMAIDGQIKATQQQVTGADAAVARMTAQIAALDIDDKARPAQEAELRALQGQRDATNAQLTVLLRSAQTYLPQRAGAAQTAPAAAGGKPFDPSQYGKPAAATPASGPAATPMPGTGAGLINAPAPQ
jgi:hypothetical protein